HGGRVKRTPKQYNDYITPNRGPGCCGLHLKYKSPSHVRFRSKADVRCRLALMISGAIDPKRTTASSKSRSAVSLPQCYLPLQSTGEIAGETARVHHAARRRIGMA